MWLINDFKHFFTRCKAQDFPFYCLSGYIVFEYLRPHTIYPALDFLPWAQLFIVMGVGTLIAKGRLKFQFSHFILSLFVIVSILSCFTSTFPDASFKNIYVIISWLGVVLFFTSAVKNIEQFKLILIMFLIIIFKMSFFGAKTWTMRGFGFTSWGISGPNGWFQNSGELALIMVIFSCLSYGFISGLQVKHKLYYLAPITGVMTIIAASSRGSQLAILVVIVIGALTIKKINIKNLVLFGLILWLGYTFLPAEQKARFSTMGSDGTSESRLMYWEKGLDMLSSHKWLGIGYAAFPDYFETYYAPSIVFENFAYRREVAHNTLIQVSSEMGYLGLITYLLIIAHLFVLTYKTRKFYRIHSKSRDNDWILIYTYCVDLGLIGYMIGSFFMSVAQYPYIYLYIALNQSLLNVIKLHCMAEGVGPASAAVSARPQLGKLPVVNRAKIKGKV